MRIALLIGALAVASPAFAVDTFPMPTCSGQQSCEVQPNFPGVDERSQEVRESERCIVQRDGALYCYRVEPPERPKSPPR